MFRESVGNKTFQEIIAAKKDEKWEDITGIGTIMKKIIYHGVPNMRPQKHMLCKISYSATRQDGCLAEPRRTSYIHLGDCDVVPGLDLAISFMNVGEISEIGIKTFLAYGSKGLEPRIPPYEALFYNVQLHEAAYDIAPENLTMYDRQTMCEKKHKRGGWWYDRGEYELAVYSYRRALDYLDGIDSNEMKDDENDEIQNLFHYKLDVYNDIGMAQLKLELYDAALKTFETVLQYDCRNVEALRRKAKVYIAKKEYKTAVKLLQEAKEISPRDTLVNEEINSLRLLIEEEPESGKALAKKLFNENKLEIIQLLTILGTIGLLALAVYRLENYNEINVNKNKESTKVSKENQKVYKNPTNFIDDNKVDTTTQILTMFGAIRLVGLAVYRYKYV